MGEMTSGREPIVRLSKQASFRFLRRILLPAAGCVLLALLLRWGVIAGYTVPTASMEPVLRGDPGRGDKVAVFKDVVKNYYVWVDEVMGRVLGWFPPDRQTVIVSDHGFYGPRRSGKKGTSEHSEWGIFLARSPLYEAGARFGHLTVLDICPTLLAMMGLPPAHDMPGAILTEPATKEGAKRLGKLDKHRVDSYMSLAPATGPAGERDPKVDEEIRKQLRSLGYIN